MSSMFNSIEFEEGVRAIYVICLEKDYATNKNKNRSRRFFFNYNGSTSSKIYFKQQVSFITLVYTV